MGALVTGDVTVGAESLVNWVLEHERLWVQILRSERFAG